VNTDTNSRGFLNVGGSHSLEKFINDVARDVTDPEKNISVWKRAQAHDIVEAKPEDRKEIRARTDLRIGALGSGSDYTAFIDHLGVASLNLVFTGESPSGIYHSIYDDFYWYTHFSDTDFVYGRVLAQTVGTTVMRFADADVLPYEFGDFADTIHKYSDELKKLLKDQQDDIRERNQRLEDGVYEAVSDPRHPTVAPKREEVAPSLNFGPLDNAQAALARSAQNYSAALKNLQNATSSAAQLQELNKRLMQTERKLLNNDGVPRRPWYRHLIYAPGWYTGYDAKTLPGIREAIEERRYQDADKEISRVAKVLEDYTAAVDAATSQLQGR
jgi:N-acetylated-alpha-linked acidic dipeptidase